VTELISAELLRLRTVRSPRYVAIGLLAVFGLMAAVPVLDSNSGPSGPGQVTDDLRMLLDPLALVVAIAAASYVGGEFKRGTAAMTYLSHPDRARVAAAQLIAWAGVCCLLAVAVATMIVGLELSAASADHVNSGFSTIDVSRLIAGAAFGGAVMGTAGVLAAAVTRNPTTAGVVFIGYDVVEGLIAHSAAGISPYLPLGLASSVMGLSHDVPGPAALALLLAYIAVFALCVRKWALPRDLT
jgi:ABC-type transport system involved in multi-copper enzyme maturation permease subunit